MPSTLPDGQPVPLDGSLPATALAGLAETPLGVYVHIPYCRTRCGYCDFNTYTANELDGTLGMAGGEPYVDSVLAELRLAGRVLGFVSKSGHPPGETPPPVSTVFFGGGTPTLLPPADLGRIVAGIRDTFGLAADAEITTEANPDTVDERSLAGLREAGFTRISLGMQSARAHVLAALDRVHTPGRAVEAVDWARQAGFEHVSLDLIYGAPTETADDWQASLDAVAASGVDHVSAYSLIVEAGTRLHRQVNRGEVVVADEDTLADRYVQADETLTAAGLSWYEVSNWATTPDARCHHNEAYWRGTNWWGLGPGAHSHVGGVRWWNVKHPTAYAGKLAADTSPGYAREVLSAEDQRVEEIMLRLRMVDGLPLGRLHSAGRKSALAAVDRGLLEPAAFESDLAVLTRPGRLLADALVRDFVD